MAALAARRALTARFVREEPDQRVRRFDEIRRVVEEDDGARTEHRPVGGHRVEVIRKIEVLLEKARGRTAAGLHRDDLAPDARAAGEFE